jgi:hypothetical protein
MPGTTWLQWLFGAVGLVLGSHGAVPAPRDGAAPLLAAVLRGAQARSRQSTDAARTQPAITVTA